MTQENSVALSSGTPSFSRDNRRPENRLEILETSDTKDLLPLRNDVSTTSDTRVHLPFRKMNKHSLNDY